MESLDKISEYLFEHETITGKEFMKIFREIKGIPEPEEKKDEKNSFFESSDSPKEIVDDPNNLVTDNIFDE